MQIDDYKSVVCGCCGMGYKVLGADVGWAVWMEDSKTND